MLLRSFDDARVLHLHPAVRWLIAAGARYWDGSPAGGAWLWSLEDRWFLEVHQGSDGEGGDVRPNVRLNGFPVPGLDLPLFTREQTVEAPAGSVIESDDGRWVLEREPEDPPPGRGGGRLPQGTPPQLGPDEAREAFFRGDEDYAEAALVLARNTPDDVRLREAFRRAATSGVPAIASAGIRGLSFLAARGLVEADAARKPIARVKDDAPLELRMHAAIALARFDALAALPRLLPLVREAFVEGEHPAATVECARALVAADAGDASVREELLREAQAVAADAAARKRRASAARVLGVLAGGGEPRALRVLRALLGDPHESVRLAALRAAVPLDDAALDLLVDGAADEDERVRTEAFDALRRRPDAPARLLAAIDASPAGGRRDRLYAALERLT